MAIRSGLAAQLGAKAETVWGTPVTVDTFIPMVSESMGVTSARVESASVIAGRLVQDSAQWARGHREVGGDIALELPTNAAIARLLLEHMFGTVTGAGPWTFTPGDLYGKGMSMQIGVPGMDGTVRPKNYSGCKISTWEIAYTAGEIVTLGLGIIAKEEDTAGSVAAASYTAGAATPFVATNVNATIGGAAVCVKQATLSGDNKLERRMCAGSTVTKEPVANDLRDYGGSLQLEFDDYTQYTRFVNGTTAAVAVTFGTGGTTALTLTYNCRFDGETPKVGGRSMIDQPLPIKAIGSTDAAAVTAVFTA